MSDTVIAALSDYVSLIEARKSTNSEVRYYRGHAGPNHTIQPSLFRNLSNRKHEKNLLRELVSMQPGEFDKDVGVFERLVRMQHYSLPTRLLDITANPMVALFFSCINRPSEDGEVIYFAMHPSQVKYYDSDTVSCVANLANLSGRERDELRGCKTDGELLASSAGKRHLQFIKAEKPYFLPEVRRQDLDFPIAVKPRLTNRRLLAQQGAFLLFGLKTKIADDGHPRIRVGRVKIPAKHKKKIRESLDRIGINESTMFPEIESAARYVMSKVTPPSAGEIGS